MWIGGILDSASLSAEIWRGALRACRIEDEALAGRTQGTLSRKERASHRLYGDVQEVLDDLKGRFHLGLITNGAAGTQREKLRVTGIESAFRVVVIAAEAGFAKPDARIFQYALDELGVSPGEAWHIGDELRTDVAGAKAAGLTAVWLNRTGVEPRPEDLLPDIEVRSLSQLRAYL
jgi:putative hydrolase of the HAD superfamily